MSASTYVKIKSNQGKIWEFIFEKKRKKNILYKIIYSNRNYSFLFLKNTNSIFKFFFNTFLYSYLFLVGVNL